MKKIFLVGAAVLMLLSCKKDIEELPDQTDTGANTFGAKLDGEFWVPQKFGVAPTAELIEARFSANNAVFINARNFASSPTETEFELYIRDITGPGTYQLNQNTAKYPSHSASYGYFIRRRFMPLNEWITSALHTGSVTITRWDPENKVVAGTFEFTVGSTDNTADPIQVTEGRFDVTIQ